MPVPAALLDLVARFREQLPATAEEIALLERCA